ncbi:2-succinyl-5-enolpyruvyl-6-hydroxy-3-cyclohexene-1-carboxylic-acid synthase [Allobranchiibius sp. GilTou73]|uniref:2-succinyl-5-enolpyruvyl-6-hydroxy-3- cyclohexene-1-carboxylic-acid synthase n=1 Tax=Allobranchiibius sp. GilTou73 TaxID=2904523 RepID=UPI001F1761E8|nr:2-succinyl-5-enolpyruvyl-6-hydroxy-3-cyclohexene-1-carboxylic-acid synthase [Allobranchiibius sp. GilTou73]UIJ36028.1 2-succinyl-5-enolpyruvyl-6-hydroxy-3-cyclohexene-1-carboxylic-acid synthase [Allobranchiibius sp. GilTou73]
MNPTAAFASTLVDELVRHGIRDAVLSPGSRSAPLAYALQEADGAGRLRLHVRVDERTAAFLALGLAKTTRVPVPVVVTSGTAVANLHPAVLEASHAQVPMLILSADRPPELRGTGANQTTDQVHIFGGATRWFHDLGTPDERPGQGDLWRSVTSRAVAMSRGLPSGDAGPVHLNVPFRAPLVPTGGSEWTDSLEGRPGGAPWSVTTSAAPDGGDTIAAEPRTLAVLGDLPDPAQAAGFTRFAESAGWPLLAEPFGTFDSPRTLPHGPLLLQATDWVRAHLPDRVLVGGRVTLDRGVAQLLRHPDVEVEVVAPGGVWADPSHAARRVHGWGALDAGHGSVAGCADRVWADAWMSAGERLATEAGPVIDRSWPSGLAAARVIAHTLPEGSGLFVGSSSAARYLDLARDSRQVARDVVSVANRGLAGIDGSVSSAIGFALTRGGRPSYAVLGDLTFAHDANGLLIGRGEPRPDLTIVVLNDDGGGIFGTLEPGAGASGDSLAGVDASYERVFGTPTGVSIATLCAAYGVPWELVDDAYGLAARIGDPGAGIRVVEVHFDRAQQRALQERLFEVAADVLP